MMQSPGVPPDDHRWYVRPSPWRGAMLASVAAALVAGMILTTAIVEPWRTAVIWLAVASLLAAAVSAFGWRYSAKPIARNEDELTPPH